MSNTAKVTLWVVALLIVLGGLWWWGASQNGTGGYAPAPSGSSKTSQVPSQGTSDLNQDLAKIDSQMSALASDSASIDKGLNDTPVQQEKL